MKTESSEQGEEWDLEAKPLREDSANLAAVLVTGRANVLEFVHIVLNVDISLNGPREGSGSHHSGRP